MIEGNPKWDKEEWKKEGDVPGKSFVFDGQTCVSFGRLAKAIKLNPDALTVEVWAYPEQLAGWNLILTCWGSVRDGGPFHLASKNGGWPDILVDTGNNAAANWLSLSAGEMLKLREWQHIAATYDAKEEVGRIYLNGKLAGEQKHTGEIWVEGGEGRDLVLGARNERTLKWIGRLDEVRISDIARKPEELSPNFTAPQAVSPIGNFVKTWGFIKSR